MLSLKWNGRAIAALMMALSLVAFDRTAQAQTGRAHAAPGWNGRVHLLAGWHFFEQDDWDPAEDGALFGAEGEFVLGRVSPFRDDLLSVVGSFSSASADGSESIAGFNTETDLNVDMIHLGLRQTWTNSDRSAPWRQYWYGNAGVARADLDAEVSSTLATIDDGDDGAGWWVGIGTYSVNPNNVTLGLDVRYTDVEVEWLGSDLQAGGWTLALTCGFRF